MPKGHFLYQKITIKTSLRNIIFDLILYTKGQILIKNIFLALNFEIGAYKWKFEFPDLVKFKCKNSSLEIHFWVEKKISNKIWPFFYKMRGNSIRLGDVFKVIFWSKECLLIELIKVLH